MLEERQNIIKNKVPMKLGKQEMIEDKEDI